MGNSYDNALRLLKSAPPSVGTDALLVAIAICELADATRERLEVEKAMAIAEAPEPRRLNLEQRIEIDSYKGVYRVAYFFEGERLAHVLEVDAATLTDMTAEQAEGYLMKLAEVKRAEVEQAVARELGLLT